VRADDVARPTWSSSCEAMFIWQARHEPEALLGSIRGGGLAPYDLTFAAEHAGYILTLDAERVTSALIPLLDHESSMVREGALYGLARHPSDDVIERIRRCASNDPSETIRSVAADVLEDICEDW